MKWRGRKRRSELLGKSGGHMPIFLFLPGPESTGACLAIDSPGASGEGKPHRLNSLLSVRDLFWRGGSLGRMIKETRRIVPQP